MMYRPQPVTVHGLEPFGALDQKAVEKHNL